MCLTPKPPKLPPAPTIEPTKTPPKLATDTNKNERTRTRGRRAGRNSLRIDLAQTGGTSNGLNIPQ